MIEISGSDSRKMSRSAVSCQILSRTKVVHSTRNLGAFDAIINAVSTGLSDACLRFALSPAAFVSITDVVPV